jgi:hypothetical protein
VSGCGRHCDLSVILCKSSQGDRQVETFVYRKSFDIALLTFFSKLREIQGVNRHIYIYIPDHAGAAAENWASQRRDCALSRYHSGSAKDAPLEVQRARLASRSFHQTSLDKRVAWSRKLPSPIMRSHIEQSSTGREQPAIVFLMMSTGSHSDTSS